jgi:uncharacterized secreted protein with C-terminal beta-propeller domain
MDMKPLFALLIIGLVACTGPQPTVTGTYEPPQSFFPDEDIRVRSFTSEVEFQSFISSTGSAGYGGVGFGRTAMMETAVAMDSSAGAKAAPSYSTTNNQVAAVDEADIIKTDGEHIYTVTGQTLFIVKAGEDAEVIATIDLKNTPTGLFVQGDHLAVFGEMYDLEEFKRIGFVPQRGGMTFFNVYDISDRTEPTLVKEYRFEGAYFQGRMYDDKAYIVVSTFPEGRTDMPTPVIIEDGRVRSMPVDDIYYFPIPYDNVQLATVHAIDLADLGSESSVAVTVEWSNQLYMSEENIYIATTETINEWEMRQEILAELIRPQLTSADRDLIAKIEATDPAVLTQAEKKQKIFQIYERYAQFMDQDEQEDLQERLDAELKERLEEYESMTYTILTRIDIDTLSVEATGDVPGTLNNQFALDESNGVLRVATTIQPRWNWGRPMPVDIGIATADAVAPDEPIAEKRIMPPVEQSQSTNNVYTLGMDLQVIGELEGLAPGESIFSTRFMSDRLYMVTFRQVDPFFVIDLSDPAKPREMGQLKIPGFSRYLHPYDENIIIGIGRDATDMGRQQGLKISLFDVTDPAKPTELAKWIAEDQYSQSAAEWEHKAFLFDKEKELLVIPAYSYNWDYRGGSTQNYNGAMVFRITAQDIEMRGIVDHSDGKQQYGPSVERSLWIEDLLYTKSPNLLRVNEISDLSSVANVTLTSKSAGPYPVY